jgi:hypothetical protein
MVQPFCSIVGEINSSSSTHAPSVTFDLELNPILVETFILHWPGGSQLYLLL